MLRDANVAILTGREGPVPLLHRPGRQRDRAGVAILTGREGPVPHP